MTLVLGLVGCGTSTPRRTAFTTEAGFNYLHPTKVSLWFDLQIPNCSAFLLSAVRNRSWRRYRLLSTSACWQGSGANAWSTRRLQGRFEVPQFIYRQYPRKAVWADGLTVVMAKRLNGSSEAQKQHPPFTPTTAIDVRS